MQNTLNSDKTELKMHIIKAPVLEKFGINHGFSTRTGGVSEGVWKSANMHTNAEDNPKNVFENRKRFFNTLNLDASRLKLVIQSHAAKVVDADKYSPDETAKIKADGLISTTQNDILGIYTADCIPVLLAHPSKKAAAALHAGWRGIASGILQNGIKMLTEKLSCAPDEILAAAGPGINSCCFEVGEEVVEIFEKLSLGHRVIRNFRTKPHIDLPGCVSDIFEKEGLKKENIWIYQGCTFCEEDTFFSYRRNGWPVGEMLSIVTI